MTELNNQEKQLLRTAQKLREVVTADLRKTLVPASLAFVQAIGLGPELKRSVQTMPPEAWAPLARHVAKMISTPGLAVEETKKQTLTAMTSMKNSLVTAGAEDPSAVATQVVLAALRAVVSHRKAANSKLLRAVRLINEAQTEIDLLREFI